MPYKALALHDTTLPLYRTRYIPLAEGTGLLHYGYTSLDLHIPTFYTPENHLILSWRAGLEKLTVVLLVKEFSACYGTQRCPDLRFLQSSGV